MDSVFASENKKTRKPQYWCAIAMQARAEQETERANTAEAEVSRLQQELQSKSSKGRERQVQLEQAQHDLSAAQVSRTKCCVLRWFLLYLQGRANNLEHPHKHALPQYMTLCIAADLRGAHAVS